ncbi:MAG: YbaK/EbsC family protein [Candidatus Nanopelagicales bacterium]
MTAARRPRSSTPALILLSERGVEHEVHEYEHDPASTDFGQEAARRMQVDARQVFKTLIWQVDERPCVAVVPVSTTVSPKKLAAALGARRAHLVDIATAQRLSGSVVGAISPLGLRRSLDVGVDASALDHRRVFVRAGRRGVEISLPPQTLIELTGATVASISGDAARQ